MGEICGFYSQIFSPKQKLNTTLNQNLIFKNNKLNFVFRSKTLLPLFKKIKLSKIIHIFCLRNNVAFKVKAIKFFIYKLINKKLLLHLYF